MVMFFSHLLPDIERETLESGKRVRLGRNHGALVARLFVKQLQRLGTLVCILTNEKIYLQKFRNQKINEVKENHQS